MKKYLTIIIFFCYFIPINAQYYIRLNNYWDNPYFINPAAINDEYQAVFSVAARKQWIGFPGAPTTFFATGTTYLEKIQTQFGLKIYSDNVGYNTITNISLSYAYNLNLDRDWQLNLGLAASLQCLAFDQSQVNVMSNDDPALYENLLNGNNYNCDLGIQLIGKSWRLGAASQNLLSAFYKENSILSNANIVYAVYRKRTDETINLEYGVSAIQYGNILQMEFNLSSFFKFYNQNDMFKVGLFYRPQNEMGIILGYNLSESLNLSYSYDFNVSGISRGSVGSHELVLVYKLNKYAYKHYRY